MNVLSASGAPVAGVLRGVLSAWLRSWSGETGPAAADPPRGATLAQGPPACAVRVLVADDNPVNLMLMSALMEAKGLTPLLAADGAQAVALACELHFDLILMDLQMPILGGLKATAAIRRFESNCARPAVPVIAYTLTSPGARVLEAHGMNGSLAKPCDDLALEDCLVQWCPSYRPAWTDCGVPFESNAWQLAHQHASPSNASLR